MGTGGQQGGQDTGLPWQGALWTGPAVMKGARVGIWNSLSWTQFGAEKLAQTRHRWTLQGPVGCSVGAERVPWACSCSGACGSPDILSAQL